jgi:hypothetical protein
MLLHSLEKGVILSQAAVFDEHPCVDDRHALPESNRMHYSWRFAFGPVPPKNNNAFNPRSP